MLGQPEYRRVMDDLRRQISAGRLSVGEKIPSTAALEERYSVSSTVVRRAVSELRAEGLLYGQPGKGVYVQAVPSSARNEGSLADIVERLNRQDEQIADLTARLERIERSQGSAGATS